MKSEWRTMTLGDVVTLKRGYDLPQQKRIPGNVPVFSSSGISGYHNTAMAKGPGVITGRCGTIGQVFFANQDFWPLNTTLYVENFHGNDPAFVYYFLKTINWNTFTSASAVPVINRNTVHKEIVKIPDLRTQRKIASVLKKFDDKIALNNKINENLEQQAQTIFRKMFLEDTQRRKLTIRDVVANVTDGVHNTVKDDPEGHYFLLSCKNIKGGKITLGNSERKINEETFEKLRKRTRLEKGDVLLSSVGTIGELVLLKEDPFCYEFQRSVAMIKPNREIVSPEYLYEALLTQRLEIIHAAHGAVQQCVFISDIYDFIIPLPTQKELSKFDSMVVPMFDKIQQNEHEIRCLTNLRDALLLKLMNGELKAYLVR